MIRKIRIAFYLNLYKNLWILMKETDKEILNSRIDKQETYLTERLQRRVNRLASRLNEVTQKLDKLL